MRHAIVDDPTHPFDGVDAVYRAFARNSRALAPANGEYSTGHPSTGLLSSRIALTLRSTPHPPSCRATSPHRVAARGSTSTIPKPRPPPPAVPLTATALSLIAHDAACYSACPDRRPI